MFRRRISKIEDASGPIIGVSRHANQRVYALFMSKGIKKILTKWVGVMPSIQIGIIRSHTLVCLSNEAYMAHMKYLENNELNMKF